MNIGCTVVVALIAMIAIADAKSIKLQDFSVKDVESRCLKVHGEFFVHDDGTYGCTYSKGVVQCDPEQHCSGILKAEHKVTPPKKRRHDYYHYYGNRWYQW